MNCLLSINSYLVHYTPWFCPLFAANIYPWKSSFFSHKKKINWLSVWLNDWLTDWLIVFLTDWLPDWVIDWLTDGITDTKVGAVDLWSCLLKYKRFHCENVVFVSQNLWFGLLSVKNKLWSEISSLLSIHTYKCQPR